MPGADHYCHTPIMFDIETSGKAAQIIQIGAIALRTDTRFEVKLKFDLEKATPEILEMNSYDLDTWTTEAVSCNEGMEAFRKFLAEHRSARRRSKAGHSYMLALGMGYNADKFDMPILMSWHKHNEKFLPMDPRIYDVLQLAIWTLPNLRSYSLSNVAKTLGVWREGAHDAIIDCEMTADVAATLLSKLGRRYERLEWVQKRMTAIAVMRSDAGL